MTKDENIEKLHKMLDIVRKGGWTGEKNVNEKMTLRAITAVNYCHNHDIPQPEVFLHADFTGIQLEWSLKPFYIEIDITHESFVDLFIQDDMNKDHDLNYTCNISMALDIAKCFINIHNKTTEEN